MHRHQRPEGLRAAHIVICGMNFEVAIEMLIKGTMVALNFFKIFIVQYFTNLFSSGK